MVWKKCQFSGSLYLVKVTSDGKWIQQQFLTASESADCLLIPWWNMVLWLLDMKIPFGQQETVLTCWYSYWIFLSSDVFYGFSWGLNPTALCLVGFTIAGKDWGLEEKWVTEDEVVGYHHWLNGHEFKQTPGDSEGQGSQACCSPWGHKETWIRDWTMTTPIDNVEHWQSQSQSQE